MLNVEYKMHIGLMPIQHSTFNIQHLFYLYNVFGKEDFLFLLECFEVLDDGTIAYSRKIGFLLRFIPGITPEEYLTQLILLKYRPKGLRKPVLLAGDTPATRFGEGRNRAHLLGCLHQHIERSSKVLLIVGIAVVELVDVNTQHIHILFSRESLQEFFYRFLIAEIW